MATTNPLHYALVARGTVVLSEASNVQGNAGLVAVRILEKTGQEDTRISFSQDRQMWHVLVMNGLTFIVMAEEAFGRRIPFAMLEDVKARFLAAHGSAQEAVAYEFSTEFGPVLAERMAFFGTNPQADTLNRVKGDLNDVKQIMVENIEKVLERGERLDLLVDKTDNLQETAFTFRREARRLQQKMRWKNAKMYATIGVCVAFLIYFILAVSCGVSLSQC